MKQEPDVNGNGDVTGESDLPALPDTNNNSQLTPAIATVKIEPTETTDNIKDNSALNDLFGDVFVTHVEGPKSSYERLELEIVAYKSEQSIPLCSDPITWWKSKALVYPILGRMARYYLGIPSTSIASERVFSTAGDIVTAQRAAFNPDNVDLLIFLKTNLNIPDDFADLANF